MQISNSYGKSSSSYGSASSSSYADYTSTDNMLFQNLLKNASVQDNVTLNEDGSYSWQDNADGSTLSNAESLTKSLIGEQNGTNAKPPEDAEMLSASDIAKFRDVTGYDYVQVGQLNFVVDDNGNPVADADQPMVAAARTAFDLARGVNDLYGDGSDLTDQEIRDALAGVGSSGQATASVVDGLLDMIG